MGELAFEDDAVGVDGLEVVLVEEGGEGGVEEDGGVELEG